jgi:hypothetical protein
MYFQQWNKARSSLTWYIALLKYFAIDLYELDVQRHLLAAGKLVAGFEGSLFVFLTQGAGLPDWLF